MHINHYQGEKEGEIQGPIIPFLYPRDYDPNEEVYKNEKAYGNKMKMGNIMFHDLNEDGKFKSMFIEMEMIAVGLDKNTVPEEFVQLYEDYKKGHKIRITIESIEEKFPGPSILEEQEKYGDKYGKIVNNRRWDK